MSHATARLPQKRVALVADEAPGRTMVDPDIFQAAVRMSRLAMVLVDPHGHDQPVIFCNHAFCELTGYAEHEVLGRNCRYLQGPLSDPAAVAMLSEAARTCSDVQIELWNYRKDGTPFWNSMYFGPVHDPSGRLLFLLGSQMDATIRRDAEEASRRAERMDTLGSMTAAIAHEFNNLMTVVMGSLEGVRADPLSPRQAERLERADWAIRGASRLTQQMLSFAQRQSIDADIVDLNTVVGNVDRVLVQLAGPGIALALSLADAPLVTRIDVGQVELALINLVRNAADASGQSGRIRVGTRALGPDHACGLGEAPSVEVSVSDSGCGMKPELVRRITEPFFTTKARGKGTGLGLSMVSGFVQQSNGRLLIESQEGQGTTIRLVFPCIATEVPA